MPSTSNQQPRRAPESRRAPSRAAGSSRPAVPSRSASGRSEGARYEEPPRSRYSEPSRRSAAPSRSHRRRRSRLNPLPVAVGACCLLVIAGFGVFGLSRLFAGNHDFSESNGLLVSAAAAEAHEACSQASIPAMLAGDAGSGSVMPCYSEDAFVVSYLDVAENVTTHPMLTQLQSTLGAGAAKPAVNEQQAPPSTSTSNQETADSSQEGSGSQNQAPAKPVDVGGSGQGNIANWKTVNSDVVGWLKIPGTNINYAVVQGPNTNYYTSKGYDKNYSKNGVIWMDSRCGVSTLSGNTVLYGHNWTNYSANPRIGNPNDVMFAQLTAFQHLSFAQSHPYIWFSTEDSEMVWQVFAAFYTDLNFNYISPAGGSDVINGAIARSEHVYDVPVSASDNILTLSTCTRRFGSSNRQRFVVMAKLVSSADASVSITANPSPVRPNL